ncbi:hypothetical protein [Paraflavitalea speifideaquila]|uniref:hypothetical protein n=1 Tax=Paraflavitalea speifideaquila TaxID=3076558 RepID=UPI0028E322FD|nr:hypothetical protein [Paraflavitalea speifideiaquila]
MEVVLIARFKAIYFQEGDPVFQQVQYISIIAACIARYDQGFNKYFFELQPFGFSRSTSSFFVLRSVIRSLTPMNMLKRLAEPPILTGKPSTVPAILFPAKGILISPQSAQF